MLSADPRTLVAWNALLVSWDAWLLTVALVALVPTLGYLRFRRLQRDRGSPGPQPAKLSLYAKIICGQWLLVVAMWLVARRHRLSLADFGERAGDPLLTFGSTLALLAVLAVVTAIILRRLRRSRRETLTAAVGRLEGLLPASRTEHAAFALVSLTAGVCEELLYRGWLVNVGRAATGSVWAGVVISSAVFGIGHAYQGPKGMLRTGLIGLQLGVLFVAVGSLIPGQVLHAAVDVVTGVALARAVSRLRAAEADAVSVARAVTAGEPLRPD